MNAQKGIEESYRAQDNRCIGWGAMAQTYMHKWVKTKGAKQNWTIENFREYAEARGLPPPKSGSAYGRVVSLAHKYGLIEFQGYYPASKASAHYRPLRVWRAA